MNKKNKIIMVDNLSHKEKVLDVFDNLVEVNNNVPAKERIAEELASNITSVVTSRVAFTNIGAMARQISKGIDIVYVNNPKKAANMTKALTEIVSKVIKFYASYENDMKTYVQRNKRKLATKTKHTIAIKETEQVLK